MTSVFLFITQLSVTGGIVTLIIFFLKVPLLSVCGGGIYNKLCLIAILAFVIPMPDMSLFGFARGGVLQTAIADTIDLLHVSEIVLSTEQWFRWHNIAALVWISVAFVLVIQAFVSYILFHHNIIRHSDEASTDITTLLTEISRAMKCRGIRVCVSSSVSSPMVVGFLKPLIILPARAITNNDLTIIFKHELIHMKRYDHVLKFIMTFVRALHWFNPLIYLLVHCLNESCEYGCDEELTKNMSLSERRYYGEMILYFMFPNRASISTANALVKDKNSLKRRLILIMDAQMTSRRKIALVLSALVIFAVGVVAYAQTIYTGIGNIAEASAANATDLTDYASSTDYVGSDENGHTADGIALVAVGDIVFTAMPSDGTIQMTEENFITNSTRIRVTAIDFADSDMINVYLFISGDANNPIGYAALSENKEYVIFDNLVSTIAYKIGIMANGKDGTVELKIAD
jgi:beta-lactamase regulating signal transducer with metallopeptidase domain